MVHAVNTTNIETVDAYRKVISGVSEMVKNHISYQKYHPSGVPRRYERTKRTTYEAPGRFSKVDDVFCPIIMNANTVQDRDKILPVAVMTEVFYKRNERQGSRNQSISTELSTQREGGCDDDPPSHSWRQE